jgi:hypothetical protein
MTPEGGRAPVGPDDDDSTMRDQRRLAMGSTPGSPTLIDS